MPVYPKGRRFKVTQRAYSGGEVLFNGIQNPLQFPPLDIELYQGSPQSTARFQGDPHHLTCRREIPVPYLISPPASRIVRSAAGTGGRQLWVDDFLIAYRGPNVTRVYGTPVRIGSILTPSPGTRPHEEFEAGQFASMSFSDGVWFDAAAGLYKTTYWAGKDYTGYAESATGLPGSYTFPNLGLVGSTNVCKVWTDLPNGHDSATTWYNPTHPDPNKRWMMAATRLIPGVSQHQDLHYSADGKTWGAKVASTGQCGDRTTFFWDPILQRWVWSVRDNQGPPGAKRYRRFWSQVAWDSGHWTYNQNYEYPQVTDQPVMWKRMTDADTSRHDMVFPANDIDAGGTPVTVVPTELYNVDGCGYESVNVYAHSKLDGNPNYAGRPKVNEVQLEFGRNGFHSSPANNRVPFIKCSTTPGDAMWGNVQSVNPVVFVDQDKIRMHVSGRTGMPGVGLESGACSTILFELRRDGFAGLQFADGIEDQVRTPRVRFYSGTRLYVNWQASGTDAGNYIKAEFRNEVTGQVYAGFAKADSGTVSGDTTWSRVMFPDLAPLVGEPIELRFYGRGGTCWAWGITNNAGDAGGFIHQGRP